MQTHDLLARISAVLSFLAACWNGLVAILYIAMFIWFLVGFLWFVPLFLVVIEGLAAVAILVVGAKKLNPIVPAIGLFASLCCFNVLAATLELVSLALQIGAVVTASNADTSADRPTEEADYDDVELMPLPTV
ncbi:MAG: hypothetical protein H6737_23715 [Alphaproteobacteria bacterium]|nr:hypothetical protein [Alphaproteobacteria bacterium]